MNSAKCLRHAGARIVNGPLHHKFEHLRGIAPILLRMGT